MAYLLFNTLQGKDKRKKKEKEKAVAPVVACACGIPMLRRRVGLVVVVVGVHLVSPFRCCVMVLPLFTGVVAA